MTTKLLGNQLRSILNDPVEGFTVELADESDMFEWKIWLEGPKDTAYSGGIFQLSLKFPKDYPMSPPELKFVSDFWHPNVFPNGKVCLSILHPPGEDAMSGELPEERWLPTQSVTTIILSLLSVLNDPNCASPANVDSSVEWRNNREAFKNRCRKLVDKANRECPSHVVIPHPETDPEQHKRRVQKFHEMNKDLDYDDFYDHDAEEDNDHDHDNDDNYDNDDNDNESSGESVASEDAEEEEEASDEEEQSPQAQPRENKETIDMRKSSEEVVSESAEEAKKEKKEKEKEKEETASRSSSEETTKPATSKGKEAAPGDTEIVVVQPSSSSHASTSSSTPAPTATSAPSPSPSPSPSSSSTHTPAHSSSTPTATEHPPAAIPATASSSSSGNNNNIGVVATGKKGKGKKAKKCIIM